MGLWVPEVWRGSDLDLYIVRDKPELVEKHPQQVPSRKIRVSKLGMQKDA